MLSRRQFVTTAVGGLAAAAATRKSAKAKGRSELHIGVLPVMISPLWNAHAQGLFQKAGIDVKFIVFQTGPSETAALQSGVIHLAWGGTIPFYSVRSNGAPIRWPATLGNYNGADGMVVGPNSPIKSVKDLAGKKIAVPFYTTVHGPLMLMLKAHGISSKDVQLINLAPPQAAAAVLSGTADAAMMWPPFTYEVVARGGRVLFHAKDTPGGGWSWTGFAANDHWANANVELLGRFYKIFDEGRADLEANRERIVKTAVSVVGLPEGAARQEFAQLLFPPLVDNVVAGTRISMCDAEQGKGIGLALDQARQFYQKVGAVKTPVSYSEYLSVKALDKLYGKACRV